MDILKDKVDVLLNEFIEKTDIEDSEDVKRTKNYLEWVGLKTKLVKDERDFKLNKDIDTSIKRGSVVWIDFGFNIGNEFGGRHPAIILRRTKESILVLPLSSQEPTEVKDFHVEVDKVYGFKNIKRWGNVLRIRDVSIQRIDVNQSIGNVKGYILQNINDAIDKSNSRKLATSN